MPYPGAAEPNGGGSGGGDGTNVAAVVLGVLLGLAVVAAAAVGLFVWRRRQQPHRQQGSQLSFNGSGPPTLGHASKSGVGLGVIGAGAGAKQTSRPPSVTTLPMDLDLQACAGAGSPRGHDRKQLIASGSPKSHVSTDGGGGGGGGSPLPGSLVLMSTRSATSAMMRLARTALPDTDDTPSSLGGGAHASRFRPAGRSAPTASVQMTPLPASDAPWAMRHAESDSDDSHGNGALCAKASSMGNGVGWMGARSMLEHAENMARFADMATVC